MKKTLLLFITALLLNAAKAQDTVRISACTKFWKTNAPVTGTLISSGLNQIQLDSTHSCADFEFILSQFPPGSTFSFNASKDHDDPLNGLTVLDLVKTSTYILGLQQLPAFGMLSADVNLSNHLSGFDILISRNLQLGKTAAWTNAPVWRFFPDYWLPFPNPNNPFQSIDTTPLTLSELKTLNGDTIELIGIKTGDADGDANPGGVFIGPGTDSIALLLPDIMLEAGVATVVPVLLPANKVVYGIQLELSGIPGTISFDTITLPLTAAYAVSKVTETAQNNQIRTIYMGTSDFVPADRRLFLHLTANTAVALKDALQIKHTTFNSFLSDIDDHVFRLYLEFSHSVATSSPPVPGFRILTATPNPFQEQAQVQIELEQPELVLLEIFDLTGKTLLHSTTNLLAGVHFLDIPGSITPKGSTILYRVSIGAESKSGKLFRL